MYTIRTRTRCGVFVHKLIADTDRLPRYTYEYTVVAVAIAFPTETYKSATAQFIRSSQPETSVCTSTVA